MKLDDQWLEHELARTTARVNAAVGEMRVFLKRVESDANEGYEVRSSGLGNIAHYSAVLSFHAGRLNVLRMWERDKAEPDESA